MHRSKRRFDASKSNNLLTWFYWSLEVSRHGRAFHAGLHERRIFIDVKNFPVAFMDLGCNMQILGCRFRFLRRRKCWVRGQWRWKILQGILGGPWEIWQLFDSYQNEGMFAKRCWFFYLGVTESLAYTDLCFLSIKQNANHIPLSNFSCTYKTWYKRLEISS